MASLKIQTTKYREFKTKFIYYIDEFFKGNDASNGNESFWGEFFLYNANLKYISDKFKNLSTESIIQLKDIIMLILLNSITVLKNSVKNKKKQEKENDIHDSQTNVSKIRQSNALDMIYSIFCGILDPQRKNEAILGGLIMKRENNQMMTKLAESLKLILLSDVHEVIKSKIIRLIVILTTENDDSILFHNFFIQQFLDSETFLLLVKFVTETKNEISIIQAFVLISVLANYNKYDSKNTYLILLSNLKDHKFFSKFVKILSNICVRNKSLYYLVMNNSSNYKSFIKNMLTFSKNNTPEDKLNIYKCYDLLQKSIFLLFYELVYRNEYFLKVLYAPRIEEYPDVPINTHLTILLEKSPLMKASTVNDCIGNFLSLSSFLFCKISDENDVLFAHSILLTLTCLCENHFSLLNITNSKQENDVYIYKMKYETKNRITAGYILDLMALFITNNLDKKDLFESYYQALLIIQKIVFYLTQMKKRFVYHWSELYKSLFLMISNINKNILKLKNQILLKSIINMLIRNISLLLTDGKIFMDDLKEYDILIKTIIENKQEFMTIKNIKIKLEGLSSSEDLVNLNEYLNNEVLKYFKPIDEVIEAYNNFDTKQGLDIQIKNYTDNVEFKEIIDTIENYYENPYKKHFFIKYNKLISSYLRIMIINDSSLDDFVSSVTASAKII